METFTYVDVCYCYVAFGTSFNNITYFEASAFWPWDEVKCREFWCWVDSAITGQSVS